jgi:hypothetical protein
MQDEIANVMIHIDETLDEAALTRLEDKIREDRGVVSVGHNPHRPHLMLVAYDSAITRSSSFVHPFEERGLHAQLVGL